MVNTRSITIMLTFINTTTYNYIKQSEMELLTQKVPQQIEKKLPSLEKLEYQILEYSGLKIHSEIYSKDVGLNDGSWLHEITCGWQNKQHIVLLHGYGGCALTYVRLFKELATKYCVHALDHMGMAMSGRRPFPDNLSQTQMVDYFIDALEQWRMKSEIQSFEIAGHSFGGYMAAAYSTKYPKSVRRLILISPVGTKYTTKEQNELEFQRIRAKGSFSRRMFLSLAKTLIGWEITPSRILNWMVFGNMILNRAVGERLKLEGKEAELWKQLLRQTSKITPTSEVSFWRLFYMPGAGSNNPIIRMITETELPFEIQFYYGDSDWMEKRTAFDLCQEETINKISYTVIQDAGHQIIFDNPPLIAAKILGN